jgi:hypothetical protein
VADQSTQMSGEQSRLDVRASVLELQAFRAEQRATQQAQADLGAFDRWLEATSEGNAARAAFAEQRFSPELDTSFRSWLALDPFSNTDAPGSPLEMDEYVTPDETADAAAGDDVLAVLLIAAGPRSSGAAAGGRYAFRRRRKGIQQRCVAGRTRHEPPAAVGARATEVIGTVGTPCALERTDPGVGTGRVQVPVAALAVRLHGQHVGPLSCVAARRSDAGDRSRC